MFITLVLNILLFKIIQFELEEKDNFIQYREFGYFQDNANLCFAGKDNHSSDGVLKCLALVKCDLQLNFIISSMVLFHYKKRGKLKQVATSLL